MLGIITVLNALSSSANLSRASLHSFVLVLTMSLSLNSSSPSLMPLLPFPNTLRNMKEKSYPLSVFVSLSQTCHTFLVSSFKISFPFPDHPRSPSLLLFQYEFIFPGEKKVLGLWPVCLFQLMPALNTLLCCIPRVTVQVWVVSASHHNYKNKQTKKGRLHNIISDMITNYCLQTLTLGNKHTVLICIICLNTRQSFTAKWPSRKQSLLLSTTIKYIHSSHPHIFISKDDVNWIFWLCVYIYIYTFRETDLAQVVYLSYLKHIWNNKQIWTETHINLIYN